MALLGGTLRAQKAFSNYDLYPVLSPYLDGTEASGLYEARLGAEEIRLSLLGRPYRSRAARKGSGSNSSTV